MNKSKDFDFLKKKKKKKILIDFELSYAHWLKEGPRCIGTVPAEDVTSSETQSYINKNSMNYIFSSMLLKQQK